MFVRVQADVTDVNRKMKQIEGALGGVDRAAKGATLQTGRLGNQFAGLAGQIAHVHPIVGNLAGVLGNFAIGAGLTVGVLAGVAAIAVVYDKLTKATREATAEQNKLIASLEKAIHLKGLGPGGETVDQTKAATDRAAALQKQITLMEGMIVKDAMDADVLASNLVIQRKINALVIERQNALNTAAAGQSIVNEKVNAALKEPPKHIDKTIAKVKELSFSLEQLRATAEEFWGPMRRFNEAFALPNLVEDMTPGAVDISDSVKIANDQAKKINDEAARHAQMIHDAVWGSAAALANQVVGALNIGGGGKGSNLGGAIGGTAGFAAGFVIGGPAGGAIGSLIGNIGGSLIGGLFDHKKAIDINTAAVRQNTAALLLNSPSGYKTAGLRYDATEVKDLRRGLQRYATRGGAPALVTP